MPLSSAWELLLLLSDVHWLAQNRQRCAVGTGVDESSVFEGKLMHI